MGVGNSGKIVSIQPQHAFTATGSSVSTIHTAPIPADQIIAFSIMDTSAGASSILGFRFGKDSSDILNQGWIPIQKGAKEFFNDFPGFGAYQINAGNSTATSAILTIFGA